MQLIVAALLAACVVVCHGASSSRQRSGLGVSVSDGVSSQSASGFDQDAQDDTDANQPRPVQAPKRMHVLPPIRGSISQPVAGAVGGYDQDQDASDGSDPGPSVPQPPIRGCEGSKQKPKSPPSSKKSRSSGRTSQNRAQTQAQAQSLGTPAQTQAGGGPVDTGVVYPPIVEGGVAPPQVPGVWDALDVLRGRPRLPDEEVFSLLTNGKAGVDYPEMIDIPDQISFNCANVKQPGYYADMDFKCKIFRRCDINGFETSYVCPEKQVFSQILLVCVYWYEVDCSKSAQFQDYSNSRLYHSDWLFLDTPPEADLSGVDASVVSAVQASNAGRGPKKNSARRRAGSGGSRGRKSHAQAVQASPQSNY